MYINMSRLSQLLKLASITLSNEELGKLNTFVANRKGLGQIAVDLQKKGYDIGKKIGKNKYQIIKNNEIIANAIFVGDSESLRVSKYEGDTNKVEGRKRTSKDAYTSPGAIWDWLEKKKERS